MITARQWRTEIEGVIGLKGGFIGSRLAGIDLAIVIKTAEAMEIPVDRAFLTRVRSFESQVLKAATEGKRDAPKEGPCTRAQEEECRILYGQYFEATCRMCRKEEENARQ